MKLKKAIVFVLCAVLALPMFACGKAARPGGGGGVAGDGKTYTVTFYVGAEAEAAGATLYNKQVTVERGKAIGRLPVPSGYDGYNFVGWFMTDGTQLLSTTPINSSFTVTAHWISAEEQEEAAEQYENNLSSWSEAGHLYIHYKRYDHMQIEETVVNGGAPNYDNAIGSEVYKDRGLWLWPKNDEGRLFNPMKIDISGAVYDILLSHNYNDAGWDKNTKKHKGMTINYDVNKGKKVSVVGMQLISNKSRITGTSFWENDGGDNDLTLEKIKRADGSYHWFVTQGSVTQGSATFVNKKIENPYKGLASGSMTTRTEVGNGIINSNAESEFDKISERVKGWEEDSVGYQIFIASFADSDGDGIGDLRGIINKLDYLDSLNVDVLWLTPFQSSTNYHGYDIKDYYSVDSRFGTLADYRELVYKVHQKGMKIVMDFVLNHTSKSNPWFVKSQNLVKETVQTADGKTSEIDYRQFYTWINKEQYAQLPEKQRIGLGENHDGQQWFGPLDGNGKEDDGYYFYSSFSSDMPELNYDYQPVRDAVIDVCKYWMAFGLDGFRLDAVKHIYMANEVTGVGKTLSSDVQTDDDDSYNHDRKRNINFYREFNYRLKTAYPNAFVVGENLDGDPNRTATYYQGIDSQFNFNLYYDVARGIAQSSGIGFNSQTTEPSWMYGALSSYKSGFQKYSAVNPNFIDGQFTSNHDLPRARDRVNIKNTVSGDGKIDDEYFAFYDDGTMDGSREGSLSVATVERTDVLLRMYYAFQMTIPGITWIYYGDELGMSGIMQYTLDSGSTSTTASASHEDRIYRQPMKWYTEMSKNASYDIGFNNYKAELTGLNATDYLKGADEQSADNGSILNWVKTLTGIRNEYGLGKSVLTAGGSGNKMEYTVKGTNGSVKVYIYAAAELPNATPITIDGRPAKFSATIGGKSYGVLVTAA